MPRRAARPCRPGRAGCLRRAAVSTPLRVRNNLAWTVYEGSAAAAGAAGVRSTAAAGDGLLLSGLPAWFDRNNATGTATSTSAAATAAARWYHAHGGTAGGALLVRAASSSPAVCGRAAGSGDSARSTVWMNSLGRSGRASRSRLTSPVAMRARDLAAIGAFDRVLACHHPVEQDSEAVDVGRARGRPPVEELGREIERRAGECRSTSRSAGRELRARAEVHQDRPAAFLAHDVLRLDVAVDEAAAVNRGERLAEIHADGRRFLSAQRAARAQLVFHRAAVDELHPQADEPLDCSTPWTTTTLRWRTLARSDPSRSTRLESAAGVLGRDREELERDVAAERVAGAIDLGESSLADRFDHRERSPVHAGRRSGSTSGCDLGLERRLETDRVGIAIDARERREDAQLGEHGAFVSASRLALASQSIGRSSSIIDASASRAPSGSCGLHGLLEYQCPPAISFANRTSAR